MDLIKEQLCELILTASIFGFVTFLAGGGPS